MVACEASAKFGKRSTAYIAVRPMAGTARVAPDMAPLTTSCVTSASNGDIARSGYLHQCELASANLVVAELAVDDVADVGEIAGAARALVVDFLALRAQLQSVHRAVDLGAATLANLAHVVVDGDACRRLRLGDGQRNQACPVGCLRLVGIRLGDAQPLPRELIG